MREVLFRGKRVDNGKWVEGYYCKCIEALGMKISKSAIQETDENGLYFREIDPNTIGQFTGLCDKNGKKIFEGDILSDGAVVEWIENLVWDSCGSRHSGFYCKKWTMDGGSELSWHLGFTNKIEVIGNIYDNPELLEGI